MAHTKGAPIIVYTPRFLPFVVIFHIVLTAVRIFDWTIYGIRIRGREHFRGLKTAVIVSNHTLLLDPGIVAHAIRPRRTYFTMLEETALIPWLGTFVRLLGAVPIPERPNALRELEGAARTAFHQLGFIHFFPEGELWRENQQLQPFHPGAFLIACPARSACGARDDGSAPAALAGEEHGSAAGPHRPAPPADHDRHRRSRPAP